MSRHLLLYYCVTVDCNGLLTYKETGTGSFQGDGVLSQKWPFRDLTRIMFSVNFLQSIMLAIDQSGENPLREGPEPVSVSAYVNKLLGVLECSKVESSENIYSFRENVDTKLGIVYVLLLLTSFCIFFFVFGIVQ